MRARSRRRAPHTPLPFCRGTFITLGPLTKVSDKLNGLITDFKSDDFGYHQKSEGGEKEDVCIGLRSEVCNSYSRIPVPVAGAASRAPSHR